MDRTSLELRGGIFEAEICNLLRAQFKDSLIIHNKSLMCPILGKETQIDVILVKRHGIFVIEAKNIHGWIKGDYNDEKWRACSSSKKVMTVFNTLNQNFLHIRSLEYAMSQKGYLPSFKIHNLICVPDNTQIISNVKEITNYSRLPYVISKLEDSRLEIDVHKYTSLIRKL